MQRLEQIPVRHHDPGGRACVGRDRVEGAQVHEEHVSRLPVHLDDLDFHVAHEIALMNHELSAHSDVDPAPQQLNTALERVTRLAPHDYLIVITEFSHGAGKKAQKEPVKQYIPINRIKRISLMRTERLIHI